MVGTGDVLSLGKGRNRSHETVDVKPLKGCQVEGDLFRLLVQVGERKGLLISV